jgi:ATP sulfurylase
MLRAREDFPTWFMRDEVQNMLRQRINSGTELFH